MLIRKPTPRTVAILRSTAGGPSSPILRRSHDMCMSSVFDPRSSTSPPHLTKDRIARDHFPPGVLEEDPQKLVFLVGQGDFGAVDEYASCRGLEPDATDLDDRVLAATVATQECSHTCHQLGETKRLADVVVGARVQPDHEVDFVGPGGQHQHGERGAMRTNLSADLEAVHARKAEIENQQVEITFERLLQRSGSGRFDRHRIPFTPPQGAGKGVQQWPRRLRLAIRQSHEQTTDNTPLHVDYQPFRSFGSSFSPDGHCGACDGGCCMESKTW